MHDNCPRDGKPCWAGWGDDGHYRCGTSACTPAPSTLPPANTEADVERVASDDDLIRRGDALAALQIVAEAQCLDPVRVDSLHRSLCDVPALSLTRPAGGEEVRDPAYDYAVSLLRALHGKHFSEQAGLKMLPDTLGVLTQIDNLTSALTKPPALPKEGEEAIRARARAAAEAWRVPCSVDPNDPSLCVPKDDCVFGYEQGYFAALSSLPVRSGEVEITAESAWSVSISKGRAVVIEFEDPRDAFAHFNALRAALATPQQVKEGDR